jgi:hypothetical protein
LSQQTLQILEHSLRYTLWAFLVILAVLLFLMIFLKRNRTGINPYKAALHALVFSALSAAVFFLVVSFTPLSFFENFTSVHSLDQVPLRLTALIYERSYEGFSLQGEVWNQTGAPLENVQAEVRVWGRENDVLDRLLIPVEPPVFPPGQAATFNLTYEKNSPFLYGYDVAFLASDGTTMIPHIKGFDVQ